MLIENGVWKGYDHEYLQNGILRIPEEVHEIDLQTIHKNMFAYCGGGKKYELFVDAKNPVYYSAGSCMIERKSGKIVYGTGNSKLPQDGSVQTIGTGAFAWCDFGDANIVIPSSVKKVERCAFYGAWGIRELSISCGVRKIGDFALSATWMKRIRFSETVTEIGFCDLPDAVSELTVDRRNPWFYEKNHCLIRLKDKALLAVAGFVIEIPDEVRSIAPFACTTGSIPTRLVTVPDSITQIENAVMPDSLLSIMYGRTIRRSKERKAKERGNFYFYGEGADPVAIIKAHKNSYAIEYARQHQVPHMYLEENKNIHRESLSCFTDEGLQLGGLK